MIATLPQEVTEEGYKASFDYITGKTITPRPNCNLQQVPLPVAYVSRAAIAMRTAANHANTGQEDPAMVNFYVYLNWKPETDPADSEFEVNCKAVPATD